MDPHRLFILHSAIAMLPASRIDLDYVRDNDGIENGDTTFANDVHVKSCMAGVACAIPLFNAEGLHYDGCTVAYADPLDVFAEPVVDGEAVSKFFNMTLQDAEGLFGFDAPSTSLVKYALANEKGEWSDKRKALRRLRRVMRSEGHITSEQAKHLKQFEKAA